MFQPAVKEWKPGWFPRPVRVFVTPTDFVVIWTSRTGVPYSITRTPFFTRTAERQRSEVMAVVWGGPMKRKDVKSLPGGRTHASPEQLVKLYPKLAEFMTAAVFDGGKETRQAPTLTFWCSGGLWKASVKDREESLVLWLSAEGPSELLTLLEDFCLSPAAPWRHDDVEHDRYGKRKKKSS